MTSKANLSTQLKIKTPLIIHEWIFAFFSLIKQVLKVWR